MNYKVTYYVNPGTESSKTTKEFSADDLFSLVSDLDGKYLYRDQFLSVEEIKLVKNLDN